MQSFRSSLARLAIASTLLGSTLAVLPTKVEARQPCGSFTINWGGTVRQGDILRCAVEWDSGAGKRDRYYLDIKKSKIAENYNSFELSFPPQFDGEIDADRIRVRVNGEEVDLVTSETLWDPVAAPSVTTTRTSTEVVESIESGSSQSTTAREGELVLINGELVFVDAETLAAQEANEQAQENAAMMDEPEEETEATPSDEPRSRSLFITLAEPLEEESEVEIILDSVKNPSSGGMYLVTAFARSQGAPLPSRLGAWFIDVSF